MKMTIQTSLHRKNMTDVVVVLGCSESLNTEQRSDPYIFYPWEHGFSRVQKAVSVYKKLQNKSVYHPFQDKINYVSNLIHGIKCYRKHPIIICCGYNGEAEKMQRYIIASGIPKEHIIAETMSTNTIENCIWAYEIIKCVEVAQHIDICCGIFKNLHGGPCNIHLVTNEYHMERSRQIFHYFSDRIDLERIVSWPAPISEHFGVNHEEIKKLREKEDKIIREYLYKDLQKYKNWSLYPTVSKL